MVCVDDYGENCDYIRRNINPGDLRDSMKGILGDLKVKVDHYSLRNDDQNNTTLSCF